jgi:hypothetical protein
MTPERGQVKTGIIRVVDDSALRAILQSVVDGDIEPERGAQTIWAQLAEEPGDYPETMRVFVGLASEWQDHVEQREALEGDIREEAQTWLDSHPAPPG